MRTIEQIQKNITDISNEVSPKSYILLNYYKELYNVLSHVIPECEKVLLSTVKNLPFKVGDFVYRDGFSQNQTLRIGAIIPGGLEYKEDIYDVYSSDDYTKFYFNISDVGKTVFLADHLNCKGR